MNKHERELQRLYRLSLFAHQLTDKYEEVMRPEGIYVKRWDGGRKQWTVAMYSKDSFARYQAYREAHKPPKKATPQKEVKVKKKKLTNRERYEKKAAALNRIYDLLGAPQNKIPYKQPELFEQKH